MTIKKWRAAEVGMFVLARYSVSKVTYIDYYDITMKVINPLAVVEWVK